MPAALTRNLYREDEALAALKWCILRGRVLEAAFWAKECAESRMQPKLQEALLWSWCFGFGPGCTEWLSLFARVLQSRPIEHSLDYAELAVYLASQPRGARDASALVLLALGVSDESQRPQTPDQTGLPAIPPLPAAAASRDHIVIARALAQGKTALAWYLLRPLWGDAAWDLLETLVRFKHGEDLLEPITILRTLRSRIQDDWAATWVWPLRAAAVAIAASRSVGWKEPAHNPGLPAEVSASLNFWATLPMRARRVFSPPVGALYWFTARGAVPVNETTERELMSGLEDSLRISTFWGQHTPEFTARDEERERFYDNFFPTDIPDEWSRDARLVSHGTGTMPVGEVDRGIVLERCFLRWFGELPTRAVWNGAAAACTELTRISGSGGMTLEAGLHAAYTTLLEAPTLQETMNAWDLTPVRREIVVS